MSELTPGRWSWFEWLVVLLVCGYLSMTRSFAHWGVSPLYVGEMALVVIFVARPRALVGEWSTHLVRRTPLSALAWALAISLAFGALQCLRGVFEAHHTRIALQNLAFHIYPAFFFPGLWLGTRRPDYLPRLMHFVGWVVGVYGFLYIVALSPMGLGEGGLGDEAPEDIVALAGQPSGAAVALLGVLAFEPQLSRGAVPLLLNLFVVLGIQVRAIWIALMAAVPLWSWLTGHVGQLARVTAILVAMFAVAWIVDFKIPAPVGRGGEISPRGIVGRALASVAPDVAKDYIDDVDRYATTVSWRTDWWKALWRMIHDNEVWTFVGPGYGYHIWNHHPALGTDEYPLRTPHNVFLYALGYTGWTGVFLFVGVQAALVAVLWRAYRVSGQAFGLCYWVLVIIWAAADNFLEGPQGAIPFYLLAGMAAAPALKPLPADAAVDKTWSGEPV